MKEESKADFIMAVRLINEAKHLATLILEGRDDKDNEMLESALLSVESAASYMREILEKEYGNKGSNDGDAA